MSRQSDLPRRNAVKTGATAEAAIPRCRQRFVRRRHSHKLMSSVESKSKRDENKRPNNHHRKSIGAEPVIPEILVWCQKSRETSSVDSNCMESILGRRSPIWNDPSCYKSKENDCAGDFQRNQPDWTLRISVLHSVSSCLTY